MSRIICSRWENGDQRVVVGWDSPLRSFFWLEYQPEDEDGGAIYEGNAMLPHDRIPTIDLFKISVPESVVDCMNEKLLCVLDRTRHMDANWTVDLSSDYNWRPMVVADSTGTWVGNGLVFATEEEAIQSANSLMSRWMLVTNTCAMPTNNPVNYKREKGMEVRV